jgi:hypothetical protein
MRTRHAAILVLSSLAASACGGSGPPAPEWPAGTVLAVDDVPVPAEEVEEAAGWLLPIEPTGTSLHLRRLALANVVFPRCAARILGGERREQALRAARSFREALERTGAAPAEPAALLLTGGWKDLGIETWGAALATGPGRWSDVVESPGAFHLVHLESTTDESPPEMTVRRVDFPYLEGPDADERIERALDEARLEIVDEGWRDAVPLSWVYRMKGGSS